LVIGGYVPSAGNFDSIVVGYYEADQLIYVARVRNGFTPASRAALFKHLRGLERAGCRFLPEALLVPAPSRLTGTPASRRRAGCTPRRNYLFPFIFRCCRRLLYLEVGISNDR
jgi:hypothetical protein